MILNIVYGLEVIATVEVEDSDLISTVKQVVQDSAQIPIRLQDLVFKEESLQDDQSIESYHLYDEAVISLTVVSFTSHPL